MALNKKRKMALAFLCILDIIEDGDDMIYILLLEYKGHQLFPGMHFASYPGASWVGTQWGGTV